MTQQVVIFATPSYEHKVSLEYLQAWTETTWLMGPMGIAYGCDYVGGDHWIENARNILATNFLRKFPMATDLFFFDDDVGWPAGKVIEHLRRPEDVVFGAYPKKTDPAKEPEYAVDLETVDGNIVEQDGYYRAVSGPAGFMRIKRHVLEKLAETAERYMHPQSDGSEIELLNIFLTGVNIKERKRWGEDYAFCQKARQAGFGIWLDPNIDFKHRGNWCWKGNIRDVFLPKIAAWKAKRAVPPRDPGEVDLGERDAAE